MIIKSIKNKVVLQTSKCILVVFCKLLVIDCDFISI
jgi:hypothetical protein